MSSILTNTAAMSALQTLRSINSDMETTQNRVSSGLRVEKAADNAAYWSIATTMKSDNKALGTVSDALGFGASVTDTAYQGMVNAQNSLTELKEKLVLAKQDGVDKTKIQSEIAQIQAQLTGNATAASFSGQNLLVSADLSAEAARNFVSSFTRDANNVVTTDTIGYTMTATNTLIDTAGSTGILDQDRTGGNTNVYSIAGGATDLALTATTTSDELDDMIEAVEAAFQEVTTAASDLGSISKRISAQDDFVSGLMDSIDKGVGRLVDADMNEESTRLKALQTQQQLAIQSLSIANSNSQSILQLFQ